MDLWILGKRRFWEPPGGEGRAMGESYIDNAYT